MEYKYVEAIAMIGDAIVYGLIKARDIGKIGFDVIIEFKLHSGKHIWISSLLVEVK